MLDRPFNNTPEATLMQECRIIYLVLCIGNNNLNTQSFIVSKGIFKKTCTFDT